jgi:hypothetical protein
MLADFALFEPQTVVRREQSAPGEHNIASKRGESANLFHTNVLLRHIQQREECADGRAAQRIVTRELAESESRSSRLRAGGRKRPLPRKER